MTTPEYRVTLLLDGFPSADAGRVEDLLDNLLREGPDSGRVIDGEPDEPRAHVTLAVVTSDAAAAVYAATRIVDRALGGRPGRIVRIEAAPTA